MRQGNPPSTEIHARIAAIAQNAALYEEIHFAKRAAAIDELEFYVLDRIEGLLQTNHTPAEIMPLKQDAECITRQLEAVDDRLFQRLRADIRLGTCTRAGLKDAIACYTGYSAGSDGVVIGYDSVDVFINRLLHIHAVPDHTFAPEPEMVFYQPTPARIILALIEQAQLTSQDVFYDLGSGLGHVAIMVHLLTGAATKGIEYQSAYCAYARNCAAALNLPHVVFTHMDARAAEYTDGTVFFLYTPFTGSILQTVLEKVRAETRNRSITIFSYGPCTLQLAQQSWLTHGEPQATGLASFITS
jgi:Histone methylation protein DOT1